MATDFFTAATLGASHPLAARELAHACGAEVEWVVQLVEVGIIEVRAPAERLEDWCFHSADLQCALDARRLERDFGVGLDAAALILDLEHEVRRLKAVLRARGLEREA
ncbi:MerR family transcriptional regulator [Variovorax paradoxus]|nr:MerR family transcriptional regulator [Variovorax paradoxus]